MLPTESFRQELNRYIPELGNATVKEESDHIAETSYIERNLLQNRAQNIRLEGNYQIVNFNPHELLFK